MLDHPLSKLGAHVANLLDSRSFWTHLGDLHRILKPINNAIIASQAATARMNTVVPRWRRLRDTLQRLHDQKEVEAPINEVLRGSVVVEQTRRDARTINGFKERFDRQVNCHHYAAYYLDPTTTEKAGGDDVEIVVDAFKRVAANDEDAATMTSNWLAFVRRDDGFVTTKSCWLVKDNMIDFWQLQSARYPLLANYAIRLATTVANTVISERGFSALKRTQTRLRSRLTPERLDRLIYINMNAGLAEADDYRVTGKRKRIDEEEDLTEAERAEEEQAMIQALDELRDAVDGSYNAYNTLEDAEDIDSCIPTAAVTRYLTLQELLNE